MSEIPADLKYIETHQLLLGKICNTDRRRAVIGHANPLVGLNVFQVCGYLTHNLVS